MRINACMDALSGSDLHVHVGIYILTLAVAWYMYISQHPEW